MLPLSIWMSAHAWVCGTVMQSCNLDHGMAVAARTSRPWMGWLMIIFLAVLSSVPKKTHILLLWDANHAMLDGYGPAMDMKQSETRPDAGLHACQS